MQATATAPLPATGCLPYYHPRRLPSGAYAVAHMVPGTNCASVDVVCGSERAGQQLQAEMEAQRRTSYWSGARA